MALNRHADALPVTDGTVVKQPKAKAPKPRGLRQSMSDLHIWCGLLLGWILYAMFLTGTVSYFRDELSQWMRPELPHLASVPDPATVTERIARELSVVAKDSALWIITLPDARTNVASALWRSAGGQGHRAFQTAVFDPATGQKVTSRETMGGDFFYQFHFQFHYLPVLWARWLAGFAAMFMLVAIVSGVITHKKIFIDFFTFRWGKGQRSWLDAHNALSVFGLPFHFMITWSGLVTLIVLYMPWGLQMVAPTQRAAVTSEMRFFLPAGKPAGVSAPLRPLSEFVRIGQARWGEDGVGKVQINNAGDAQARVVVIRDQAQTISTTPQYLVFDGVSGALLKAKDSSGAAALTQGVLYGLHVGRYADTVTRWLYFLVSLAGTAMVGTGLVLWTVKRRTKLPDPERPYFGFRCVERANIAAIAGLSIAMTAMLWANRLLPETLGMRATWEVRAFFIAWGAALAWALVRPAKRAWIELLWLGAGSLALLPVANVVLTGRGFLTSLADGDWIFAGMDLVLIAFALLHAKLAIRAARHRPKALPARRAAPAKAVKPAPGATNEMAARDITDVPGSLP